jgi:hypothetical protein
MRRLYRDILLLAAAASLCAYAFAYSPTPRRRALIAASATTAAPANAEDLPRCAPAPECHGVNVVQTGYDAATDTSTYQLKGSFAVAYLNAPCFEDYYSRVTSVSKRDGSEHVAVASARYYFMPLATTTPTPTPSPTTTPTPSSTPKPSPTPCPPGQKKKPNGKC